MTQLDVDGDLLVEGEQRRIQDYQFFPLRILDFTGERERSPKDLRHSMTGETALNPKGTKEHCLGICEAGGLKGDTWNLCTQSVF